MTSRFEDPRISAVVVLSLGTAVTIGANILHASESIWAKALSASVPLVLFFTAHTAAYAKTWAVRGTMVPVACVALAISYDHMNALAMRFGESYGVAKLYPLAIDGAMIVAQVALAVYRRPADTAPIDVEDDDVPTAPDTIEVSAYDLMRVLWSDGSLYSIPEDERSKVVRRELNKALRERGSKAVGASRVNTLITAYELEFVR